MLPGRVRLASPTGQMEGYGNTLVIEHGPELFSLYAHLGAFAVIQGSYVVPGQLLGTVGRTAGTKADPSKLFDVSGAHLHLEFLNRWPPRGRDLDRLNPADVLGKLGVIVPANGPLLQAATCGAGAPLIAASSAPMVVPNGSSLRGQGLGTVLLLVGVAWAIAQSRNS